MGRLVDSKIVDVTKHFLKIEIDPEEFKALQGNFKNVSIFTLDAPTGKAQVMESAIRSSTKYFTIPKEFMDGTLRKNKLHKLSGSCIKLDIGNKIFFIYVIKKDPPKD